MKTYFRAVGGVLLLTAIGKLVSVLSVDPVLGTLDVVTGLTFRNLFLLSAGLEVVIALGLFRSSNTRTLAYISATAATLFLTYRVASSLAGGGPACPCLGALTGILPITERVASNMLLFVIALMLLPSIAAIAKSQGESGVT